MCSNTIIVSLLQMMKERREGLWFFGLCLIFMIPEARLAVFKREFILVSNHKLNWTEAQTYCRFHYQDLASILDSSTNQLVNDLVSDKDVFWIGLFNKDWRWRWSLPEPGLQQTYRCWDKRQPKDGRDKNCVTLNDDGFWRVDHCLETERAFVCSHNSSEHPYVLVNQRRSWFHAQSFCRRNHRDLVTVGSDEENQALLSLMKEEQDLDEIWIGLHRPQWNWSDGSVYQFSHWYQNQDWIKGDWEGSCAIMREGQWRRRECSKRLDFLCELGVPPKNETGTTEVSGPPTNGTGTTEVGGPPTNGTGVFHTSVRIRMKIRTQADLKDPAVILAVSQQLKAALASHPDVHVSLMAVEAEPRETKRDTCEMEEK